MTAPAALEGTSFEFLPSFDIAAEIDLTARRDDGARILLLPPPKA